MAILVVFHVAIWKQYFFYIAIRKHFRILQGKKKKALKKGKYDFFFKVVSEKIRNYFLSGKNVRSGIWCQRKRKIKRQKNKTNVRSGIWTHALVRGSELESDALDHSAILTWYIFYNKGYHICIKRSFSHMHSYSIPIEPGLFSFAYLRCTLGSCVIRCPHPQNFLISSIYLFTVI
jgi:hypothetical protein